MYLIFAFDDYYPQGGANDYKNFSLDLTEAIILAQVEKDHGKYSMAQVFCVDTKKVVWDSDCAFD